MQTLIFSCLFKINTFRSALNPTELYLRNYSSVWQRIILKTWLCEQLGIISVLLGAGYELFKKKCVLYVFNAKKRGWGYNEESCSLGRWRRGLLYRTITRRWGYQFTSLARHSNLFCGYRIHAADETTQWKQTSSWNNFLAIRQGAWKSKGSLKEKPHSLVNW